MNNMLQFFRKFRLPEYEALILPFPPEVPNMQTDPLLCLG